MNDWSQKSCRDHLGNLPPTCAPPLLPGPTLHPWLTAIPKMLSSTPSNFFSNTPKTSQTEKQTPKRKPNHTLTGYAGCIPILPGYGASALRGSMATHNILKFPRPPLARCAFPPQQQCLCSGDAVYAEVSSLLPHARAQGAPFAPSLSVYIARNHTLT